jgi:ribosomal protein S27AE
MKHTKKCPKCGSGDIIAEARGYNRNDFSYLSVVTFLNPKAFMRKRPLATTLSAWVCGNCGFVEFYADSPQSIKIMPE